MDFPLWECEVRSGTQTPEDTEMREKRTWCRFTSASAMQAVERLPESEHELSTMAIGLSLSTGLIRIRLNCIVKAAQSSVSSA